MLFATLRRIPTSQQLTRVLGTTRSAHQWEWLRKQGHEINPCNSKLHPSVVKDGIQPTAEQIPVQQAYTPNSLCWGCGRLQSSHNTQLHDCIQTLLLASYLACHFLGGRLLTWPEQCSAASLVVTLLISSTLQINHSSFHVSLVSSESLL